MTDQHNSHGFEAINPAIPSDREELARRLSRSAGTSGLATRLELARIERQVLDDMGLAEERTHQVSTSDVHDDIAALRRDSVPFNVMVLDHDEAAMQRNAEIGAIQDMAQTDHNDEV